MPEKKTKAESLPQIIISRSKKEKYNEQFAEAMKLAMDMNNMGKKKKNIANSLNELGFKTRTGKSWSLSILNIELKKCIKGD
jgi:hypothetical protein